MFTVWGVKGSKRLRIELRALEGSEVGFGGRVQGLGVGRGL